LNYTSSIKLAVFATAAKTHSLDKLALSAIVTRRDSGTDTIDRDVGMGHGADVGWGAG